MLSLKDLKLGKHYNLPEEEILNLLKVSTGDSWVVRNWSDVSEWTADNCLICSIKRLNRNLQRRD